MGEQTLRLVSFRDEAGAYRLGAQTDDGVVDLQQASDGALPADMLDLIEAGPEALTLARSAATAGTPRPIPDSRLGPAIPVPRRNVVAVGRNYAEHVAESARGRGIDVVLPERAVFFTKPASSLIGPYDDIELDEAATSQLDYEVELVVVIGRRGRNIPAATAMEHVFGYTIGNDVSARDAQSAHTQWFKGKAFDRTSAIGPAIVPAADLPGVHDARLWLSVNGEVRQDSRTALMIYSIATVIEQLSLGMAVEPGDVIMTGTPAGIGHRMSPPRYLRPGDEVTAEIEGLGRISNRVVAYQPG